MGDVPEMTIHDRVAALAVALARENRRTPEDDRRTLDMRARQLARPLTGEHQDAGDGDEFLLFQVGDEQLGIGVEHVVAIARAGSVAPLPRAVRPVYGVTAWRGRPLTVLALGPVQRAVNPAARLIVLGLGARVALGIVVDAVHDLRRITRLELTPPSPGPRHAYAVGITPDGLLVVSGEALLAPHTISA